MSDEVKRPDQASLVIDARPLSDFLIDAAPGQLVGIRRAQPGFDAVVREIYENQATYGEKAGILPSEIDELRLLTDRLALLRQHLPKAQKLVEMMLETEALLDNRCQEIVRNIAKSVDVRATALKDEVLYAKYELTRKYRSAAAQKAVKTRKKNLTTNSQTEDKLA